MKRALIVYRQRLGDIVGCFPAALHLSQLGYQVDFCCYPQYFTIFETISYCRPVTPAVLKKSQDYDRIYELEITRKEYDAYRASGIRWRDYVYAKHEDLQPACHDLPYFDQLPETVEYGLPDAYDLAAPTGISQVPHVNPEWFRQQCLSLSPGPWYILTNRRHSQKSWGTPLCAQSLAHLPPLIAGARTFVTINSAPNIIAAGVRKSWHQVYEAGFGGQSNYEAPGQIVLHQPPHLGYYSWRFRFHYWRRRLMGIPTENDFGK